jgi:hypothetical protein
VYKPVADRPGCVQYRHRHHHRLSGFDYLTDVIIIIIVTTAFGSSSSSGGGGSTWG